MSNRFWKILAAPPAMLVCAFAWGCSSDPAPTDLESDDGVFVVEVVGERFRVRIPEGSMRSEARARLARGQTHGLSGELVRGDGGFNTGYSWHLKAETIVFPEVSIELCDGRPSDVQGDVDYWINNVKRYCPWAARIISEG
jgi:hypothetical protein